MLQWYIVGPIIGLVFFSFLYLGKSFGISSSFKSMCALVPGVSKLSYFKLSQKDNIWRYVFIAGTMLGGFLGFLFTGSSNLPDWYTGIEELTALQWTLILGGGFLVGFGVRYAGGCTSGHAITGLTFLQWRSLLAVVGFFIGGLLITHLLINKAL